MTLPTENSKDKTFKVSYIMGYSRKNRHPPRDGKLEILAGGGVDSSGNPGGRGDLNRKILPQGSLLTLNLIDIVEPCKKEL